MNGLRTLAGLCLIAVIAGVPLRAQAVGDVGIVAHVAGEVNVFAGAQTTGVRPKPFMELREGDRFELPVGTQLRIVYFEGGRQESWTGPASVVTGSHRSALLQGAAPKVSLLPDGVQRKIAQAPELIEIARLGRTATPTAARPQRLTPQQQAEVREARDTYRKLRATASAEDILPELFLYSVLQDHLLYTQMRPVVNEMVKRQPGSEAVALMLDYVRVKTGTE